MTLTTQQIDRLFGLVKQTIELGLKGESVSVDASRYADLSQRAATFVSLHSHGDLRGCIGTLEAYRSLAEDMASNAFSAAFRDPRFPPLTKDELSGLEVEHSILTPAVAIEACYSKQQLMDLLVPFEDGLIISDGLRRATFLPSVWSQLPDEQAFVEHLMRKAGITVWSENISCERYSVNAFGKKWQDINVELEG